ncbi:hypothetical protein [Sphingomonas carotinifaciens]|uniref:Uncharacterized protein n=2 Tax=Sphingomonas carotinifaciens TaxID=1166323 RepID=A0A1G7NI42_9SPHN|nr:hypothetical protein [Sphingomonas carotinifaciens]MBB4087074.1 hypothetical protein [Sphingomonas carotinifaciens]MWC43238.1 hypothetical protein [Sphingomonas carotinifaciens]SDF73587.1 hypothetical protein SAMN05216557_105171 [Sphingomonas carotinifaciens]
MSQTKTSQFTHQRPVTTGTILLAEGGFGHVRRNVAPDGTTSVSIEKIDLSNAPGSVPKTIQTNDEALDRAIASGEVHVVSRPTPPAPRRTRGSNARSRASKRSNSVFLPTAGKDATMREELRGKAAVERHLRRVDAALRWARHLAGPSGVHDEASARRAMVELRAAGILISGDDLIDAGHEATSRRRKRHS